MTIADMKAGSTDPMGDKVRAIYGFKPPEYAVYATDKRLVVRFADNPALDSEQRKGLAPLNPVRGEINGLIDGWRVSQRSALRGKAGRYDRRVADALVLALEHDVESAATILQQIKQDIIEDRTSWARLEYLVSALLISVLFALVVSWWFSGGTASELWRAAGAGAVGAFFSIALNIRSRTVLPDLRRISNVTDASLRVLIGFIGASVLMGLISAKAVTLGLGGTPFNADEPKTAWLVVLIVGFLAGFSERLVPDLLAKASASVQAPPPQAQARPAAEAGKAAAAGAAAAAAAPAAAAPGGAPAPELAGAAQPDDDRTVQEAAVDHCVCDVEVAPAEVTQDAELPAASGGVAPAEGGQPT
jgi:hypothetical protein